MQTVGVPREVRSAHLSQDELPPLDTSIPPWPGGPVLVGERELFVRHTPARAAGAEPALYVHGLGGASTNWTDLAYLLADRLDGQAVDLPGFGRSDPPADGYSIPAQARQVIRLLERNDRPVHLFGNSMGGAVSILVAAARPDLLATLTLVSPAMPDLRPRRGSDPILPLLLVPGMERLVDRRLRSLAPERRARALIDLCFGDPSRVPANRLAEAIEDAARRDDLPWSTSALTRALRSLVGSYLTPGERSLWRLARRISAPTLVVWGDRDRLVSVALAPRTALAIPDSRLLVLPGVGHTAQLEDPQSVARAFLALHSEAAAAG